MEGNTEINIYKRGFTEAIINVIWQHTFLACTSNYVDREWLLKALDYCREKLAEKIKIEKGDY